MPSPIVKGHPPMGGRPKGAKNKSTLLREERRAIFDEEVSQLWRETIKKMRPEYIGDQFMGTAPQKVEHSGQISTVNETPEVIAEAKRLLKEKMKQGK